MSWWEAEKKPGLMIGDEALDVSHGYFRDLASLYEEQFHRRPTLEEVAELVERGLGGVAREVLADFEEREVTGVTIKTAKSPRDQRYKVGDIFAIPLDSGQYAIGRIIAGAEKGPLLIEVFRDIAKAMGYRPATLQSGRLLPPIQMLTGWRCLKNRRWIVIGSDEGYKAPKKDVSSEFLRSDGYTFEAVTWEGKVLRKVGQKEADRLVMADASPERVEDQIEKALRKKPKGAAKKGGRRG